MADNPTEAQSPTTVLGLSFGNSFTSISFASPHSSSLPEILANEDGDRQIPSVLSYSEGEEYHGGQAKVQMVRNRDGTVSWFRDLLGKGIEDIDLEKAKFSAKPHQRADGTGIAYTIRSLVPIQKLPTSASLTPNHSHSGTSTPGRTQTSTPVPSVLDDEESEMEEKEEILSVEDIVIRHLRRIATTATQYLGHVPSGTVLTVPTTFSQRQVDMLRQAAESAGLKVLQAIHEPTAALLAYNSLNLISVSDKIVLVLDLGATRADATIFAVRGGMYTILSTYHSQPHLAVGQLFDQVLFSHFADEFRKKTKLNPEIDQKARTKLLLECENIKKTLSASSSANGSVESLVDGMDFKGSINRIRFELLGRKVFDQIGKLVEEAVIKSELKKIDIDEVLLIGGSSHIPKLPVYISSIFPTTTAVISPTSSQAYNPSDIIARGAAIQASLIADFEPEQIEEAIHPIITVVGHLAKPIGILREEDGKEVVEVVVEDETAIPARGRRVLKVPEGDVILQIFEGKKAVEEIPVEKNPKANGTAGTSSPSEDDDDKEDEEDEEEEPKLRKVVLPDIKLAQLKLSEVKSGEVEVQVQVQSDGAVVVLARELTKGKGGQGGAVGKVNIEQPKKVER